MRGRIVEMNEGQIAIMGAALLAILLTVGLLLWATLQYRADDGAIAEATRAAVLAGANAPAQGSLAGDAPSLTSCPVGTVCDAGSAQVRAMRTFGLGLRSVFGVSSPRIDIAQAEAHTRARIYAGSPEHPVLAPGGGTLYHYPTLCLEADVTVGLLAHDGVTFTHRYVDCAQLAI